MEVPKEAKQILDILLDGIEGILQQNLVGVYPSGSIAVGDFKPDTSDIDIVAVTREPVTNEEFSKLLAFHDRIRGLANPYSERIEMAYIYLDAFKRYEPGQSHPTLDLGESLSRVEHKTNWILDRRIIRERSVALNGPAPRDLIDPISDDEVRSAVSRRLNDWLEWAKAIEDPDWNLGIRHKRYIVQTMCRSLRTMATGEISTKSESVEWALSALPEPYRSTVEESKAWEQGNPSDPQTLNEDLRRLIQWAATDDKSALS